MSGNCDDICYTRTESKVHILTCHEGDYDSKVKKKGKMIMKRTAPKNLLQTSSILTTILLKFGDMVDVAFDDIDES